jgi:hypothetical protein
MTDLNIAECEHDRSALRSSPSVFLLLPIFRLKSEIFSSLIALGRLEPRPPMESVFAYRSG